MTADPLRSLGYLVHDAARLFGKKFDQRARDLGLTRAQCKALAYLARHEGINQTGLADLLEIEPITLVRLIDRMEEAGWVERRIDPADRRARRLYLTEKVWPVFARIREIAAETREEALVGFSTEEAEQLTRLLERLHANLSERDQVPARHAPQRHRTVPGRRASANGPANLSHADDQR